MALEKYRFFFVVGFVGLLISAILCVIYVKFQFMDRRNKQDVKILVPSSSSSRCQICTSKDCVLTAAQLHAITERVKTDPCTDFHSYSCGNYPPSVPNDNGQVGYATQDTFLADLKFILDEISSEDSEELQLVKKFYRNCLEFKPYDQLAIRGLKKILSTAGLSRWPYLPQNWTFENEQGDHVSLDFVLYKLGMYNSYNFLQIMHDTTDPTIEIPKDKLSVIVRLRLSQDIPMQTEYLHQQENANALKEHGRVISDIFQYFGIRFEEAEKYADEIMHFEGLLHQWIKENMKSENQPQVRQSYSNSEWASLIQFQLENSEIVVDSEDIHVFSGISGFRQFLENQHPRIIGNYLAYRFVVENAGYLGFFFRNIFRSQVSQYTTVAQGVGHVKWLECLTRTTVSLEPLLDHLYLEKRLSGEKLRKFDRMFAFITNASLSIFDDISWLNESDTKKVKDFISSVPSPSQGFSVYANGSSMKNLYRNLKFHEDSFFGNFMEFTAFKKHYTLKNQFSDDVKGLLYPHGYPGANAYAVEFEGVIQLGLPYMRLPFFSSDRPNAFSVATLGSILSHELVHLIYHFFETDIFRDTGKPEVYERYEKCVSDFYSKYKYEYVDQYLRGDALFYENFADLVGVEVTYRAFKQAVLEDEKRHMKLNVLGMDETEDQLFYLVFSQFFCQPMSKEIELDMIMVNDLHSPNKFRILGTASNMATFGTAYKCPVNSPMNPEHKCKYVK